MLSVDEAKEVQCIKPGEQCDECGTHHKVLDHLPKRALTTNEVEALNESEKIAFVEAVNYMPGAVMEGINDESVWATEEIVIATDTAARNIGLFKEHGWVVETEAELTCDCCTPREHGMNYLYEIAKRAKESLKLIMGEDSILNSEEAIRWPVDELPDL